MAAAVASVAHARSQGGGSFKKSKTITQQEVLVVFAVQPASCCAPSCCCPVRARSRLAQRCGDFLLQARKLAQELSAAGVDWREEEEALAEIEVEHYAKHENAFAVDTSLIYVPEHAKNRSILANSTGEARLSARVQVRQISRSTRTPPALALFRTRAEWRCGLPLLPVGPPTLSGSAAFVLLTPSA